MSRKICTSIYLCFLSVSVFADNFHPLEGPCRVLDTQATTGPVADNTTLSFIVRGTPLNQGAENGCGVPTEASGVFINIVATQPSGAGWASVWAYGTGQPTASFLSVSPTNNENTSTAIFSKLGESDNIYDLNLKNFGFTTDWTIDLIGYTVPSVRATTFVKGIITEKETTQGPPTVEFDLDTTFPGFRAICAEPWIDVEVCELSQYEIGDPLCGTGHIGDSFGSPELFLHTITNC